jgi:histidyl-tRNA synthetase
VDVFFAIDDGAPRERVLQLMAQLRRGGHSCETDYAGRSLKGQLTQATRVGARMTVIVGPDSATIRRQGTRDEALPLDDLEERLTA